MGLLSEALKYAYILALPRLNFQEVYGPFALSVSLMFWAFLTGLLMLTGAHLSARGHTGEKQCRRERPARAAVPRNSSVHPQDVGPSPSGGFVAVTCRCDGGYISTHSYLYHRRYSPSQLVSFETRLRHAVPLSAVPALALALLSLSAVGQESQARHPLCRDFEPAPADPKLRYIFDGTVLSVEQAVQNEMHVATVQITFRVEQAMRGTRAGQILTIREWAGLWNSGERYHPENAFCCFSTAPANLA